MNKKNINIEQELEEVLNGLTTFITKEGLPQNFEETVEKIKETYLCKNASNASVCLFWKIDNFKEQLAKMIMPKYDNVEKKNLWKLTYLWQNYNSVEHYISSFISGFEGTCCCVDKANWLLSNYMQYLIDQSVPDMEKKEKMFYKPNFGTFEEWFNFIDAYIHSMYHYTSEFLTSSAKLIQKATSKK